MQAEPEIDASAAPAAATVTLAAGLVAACGGGGGSDGAVTPPAAAPTDAEASRFLAQASMGASRAQIARVRELGFAGWLDEQFALPPSPSRWDWLIAAGYGDIGYRNSEAGFDAAAWAKLLGAPDTLRQRITLALSEIFVTAVDGLVGGGWRAFSAAAYLDMLEANAFGNHRELLQQISRSPAMGMYLTFRGSAKENPATGALPDENYARELLQLFTIGLVPLGADGTPGEGSTYGQADISGLSRVFTGWDFDLAGQNLAAARQSPELVRRPLAQVAARYESGAKNFLGTTLPAGLDATSCLTQALDAIWAHANVAPFFARQLIQRLVTSNPRPAYVARVAAAFNDNGHGVRGDLRAVIKAVLLDDEARSAAAAAAPGFGKLREPMLRLCAWARACGVGSPGNRWPIGDTSNPATRLAQSPLRSPSVFNFFRPGYAPPNTGFNTAGLVAPEFQITNESSVIGYLNFMQRLIASAGSGAVDLSVGYGALLSLAGDAAALLAEIDLLLAAGRLGNLQRLAPLASALQAIDAGSDAGRLRRVQAALLLVLAAPEFIVQK